MDSNSTQKSLSGIATYHPSWVSDGTYHEKSNTWTPKWYTTDQTYTIPENIKLNDGSVIDPRKYGAWLSQQDGTLSIETYEFKEDVEDFKKKCRIHAPDGLHLFESGLIEDTLYRDKTLDFLLRLKKSITDYNLWSGSYSGIHNKQHSLMSNKYSLKGTKLQDICEFHKYKKCVFVDKFELHSESEDNYLDRMKEEFNKSPLVAHPTYFRGHRIDPDVFYCCNVKIQEEIFNEVMKRVVSVDKIDTEWEYFYCVEEGLVQALSNEICMEIGYVLLTRQEAIGCFEGMKFEVEDQDVG